MMFVALFLASVTTDHWIDRKRLETRPAKELATDLLPREAKEIVGGKTLRFHSPGYPWEIHLWREAKPDGDIYCRRKTTKFGIGPLNMWTPSPELKAERLHVADESSFEEIALNLGPPNACKETTGYVRIVQYDEKEALAMLAAFLNRKANTAPVACSGSGECPDPAKMAAELPLDRLFIARRKQGSANVTEFVMAATQEPHGGPIIRLDIETADEKPVRAWISREIPAPH